MSIEKNCGNCKHWSGGPFALAEFGQPACVFLYDFIKGHKKHVLEVAVVTPAEFYCSGWKLDLIYNILRNKHE